jgi:large subunit ribosomal protein L2
METKIVKCNPTSPGRRHKVVLINPMLSKKNKPKASLLEPKKRGSGRNNQGRITVRHKGGGHKQKYRLIDFKRNKDGIKARVVSIEYDPNRSAHIALLSYLDGAWSYVIAAKGIKEGSVLMSGSQAPIEPGNTMMLKDMPVGTTIHAIELKAGAGAKMVRSAGTSAMLVGREHGYAMVKLRSGEIRKVREECRATIGQVCNSKHSLIRLGKAGAKRWRGVRPTVRGVAMNPVDHPHGGGEGKTSGGRHPCSPTGVKSKGKITRRNKNNDHVVRSRRKKRRRG